jgi:hypothetical protein
VRREYLTPDLLRGTGAVGHARKVQLEVFLADLVRIRDHPLHATNLWNALYFGYDLQANQGYDPELVSDSIPTVQMGERAPALAVGQFVRIRIGGNVGDVLGEVIYKEGADPDVSEDWVDPALSGRSAGNGASVISERVVIDLRPFGGSTITAKQWQRILSRAKALDPYGHLLMEAEYQPGLADLSDADYYIHHLLERFRSQPDGILLGACFREPPTEPELREALQRSIGAIRDIAKSSAALGSWRDTYFFDNAAHRRRITDTSDRPLCRSDLDSIAVSLRRAPAAGGPVYSALGPRIIEHLQRDGFGADEQALVRGASYVQALCDTSNHIYQRILKDAKDGIVETYTGRVHLRLDDDWQSGGIWRCQPVTGSCSLALIPPLIPLHMGQLEASGGSPDDGDDAGEGAVEAIGEKAFRVTLTRRDLALGRLRLPPQIAALVTAQPTVRVTHDGENEMAGVARKFGGHLTGIAWPLLAGFEPGIICRCYLEQAHSMIVCRTDKLSRPIVIEDHEVWFNVSEAEWRTGRGLGMPPLTQTERKAAPSLRDLINRAFRTRGRGDDSERRLTRTELLDILFASPGRVGETFGETWTAEERRLVEQTLATMSVERDGADLVWWPAVRATTGSDERSLLERYEVGGSLDRKLRRRMVRAHLRRYQVGGYQENPSPAKIAEYPRARLSFGDGGWPVELPPNTTWVRPSREDEAAAEYRDEELALFA